MTGSKTGAGCVPQNQHGSDQGETCLLTLYVTGTTPNSLRAIGNIRRICEEHLEGRYQLRVVDVYQEPEQARKHNLTVLPTLVKELPQPLRKIIGNLSDTERVLVGLDLKVEE
jgi:circadian clock protein KaiB